MNKKILYLLLFITTGIIFYTLQILYPNLLFVVGSRNNWDFIRRVILALTGACLCCSVISIILDRAKILPYLNKLIKFRSLLYLLVKKDFKSKYKRSILGILWTVLSPLLTMLVLTIVFSALFRFDIENFPVYLLSGQLIFTFFNEATTLSMSSILSSGAMIKKVNIPKYIFPFSRVLSSLVNLILSFAALILVMVITKAPFHWTLFITPIPIFYLLIFSLGIGLILSAAIIFFRDMLYLYNVLITVLTYFTPIFYPISIVPDKYRFIISLNPMYHYVEYFRSVAIYGFTPTLWQNVICGLMSIISLTAGLYIFYKKQDQFILYI